MSESWFVHREWEGETVFILGGGPSLQSVDVPTVLRGRRKIAINNSWALDPDATDILYFCDLVWWLQHKKAVINKFQGRIASISHPPFEDSDKVLWLQNGGQTGLDERPDYVRHGSNSCYQAMNLAVHLGVKRIVLLGIDMKTNGEQTHWHEGHQGLKSTVIQHRMKVVMVPHFQRLVEPLERLGVEVINANPDSALECWPKHELESILHG